MLQAPHRVPEICDPSRYAKQIRTVTGGGTALRVSDELCSTFGTNPAEDFLGAALGAHLVRVQFSNGFRIVSRPSMIWPACRSEYGDVLYGA
jgi:hypothetical protein